MAERATGEGEVCRRVQEAWPACVDILDGTIDRLEEEMGKAVGGDMADDGAYGLVTLLLLRHVFWRLTLVQVIERHRGGEDSKDLKDVMGMVAQEYEDWNDGFPEPTGLTKGLGSSQGTEAARA